MDFYDYATTHDLTRRAGLTNDTPAAFYRQIQAAAYVERARGVQGMAVEFNRYQSELNWSLAGRPYYKLWPAIIPLANATRMRLSGWSRRPSDGCCQRVSGKLVSTSAGESGV